MVWPAVRSLLFRYEPERMHALAQRALKRVPAGVARRLRPVVRPELRVKCLGLDLDGPVGLAAGFDKGQVLLPGLFALGFSHVEIGTITPRPQAGNDRPRLFRLPEHRALVNRMGFNNAGADACAARMAALAAGARLGAVGVNIGKNKLTPNAEAEADYLSCIDRLSPYADYVVVNVSSPNTPGLRELQEPKALERLLRACVGRLKTRAPGKALLVKLSPDLADAALDLAVEVALASGASGIIATNTTLSRQGVEAHPRSAESGGLSGAPLERRATEAVQRCYARSQGRLVIVGCGGVFSAEDAYAKIRAGASLVQVYTGLVYEGPAFVRRLNAGLARLIERDGFGSLSEAVGVDNTQPTRGEQSPADA